MKKKTAKTKKKKRGSMVINLGKIMDLNLEDVDRIAGGMIRLESTHPDSWTR